MKKPAEQRFEESYVPEPNTGCWLWTKSYFYNGYGRFSIMYKSVGAHRWILEHKLGRVLKTEEYACHSCDTKACVNPSHLWVGTCKDNIQDSFKKGRAKRWHTNLQACLRGHKFVEGSYYQREKGRYCKACNKLRQQKRTQKLRAKVADAQHL